MDTEERTNLAVDISLHTGGKLDIENAYRLIRRHSGLSKEAWINVIIKVNERGVNEAVRFLEEDVEPDLASYRRFLDEEASGVFPIGCKKTKPHEKPDLEDIKYE